jgi:hypothetical protein
MFRVKYDLTPFYLHISTIFGKSSIRKLFAECDRIFNSPTPKYTESAPPVLPPQSFKIAAGDIISILLF